MELYELNREKVNQEKYCFRFKPIEGWMGTACDGKAWRASGAAGRIVGTEPVADDEDGK